MSSTLENRWERRTILACAAVLGLLWLGAPAHAKIIYVESGGQVVAEAEAFSSRQGGVSRRWTLVTDERPNSFGLVNYRGSGFMQTLNDTGAGSAGPLAAPFLDYNVQISTPGTYQLYLRWAGHAGTADSMFAHIAEINDGPGGAADWYEYVVPTNNDFSNPPWQGTGGFEANSAGVTGVPATWNISTPGNYTVRLSMREDSAAVDAVVFQLAGLSAPAGNGPAVTPSIDTRDDAAMVYSLAPVADAYVRGGSYANNTYGASDPNNIVVKESSMDFTRKGYLSYAITPAARDGMFDAELTFQVTTNDGGTGNPTPQRYLVNVFGLNEDVDNDWSEPLITYNNAPANNPGVSGGDPYSGTGGVTSDATLLGQLIVPDLQAPFELTLTDADLGGALSAFLAADTDGIVSFVLTRQNDSPQANNLVFASRENPNYAPIMLTIYSSIPEPGTLALLGVGLAALGRRRRRS